MVTLALPPAIIIAHERKLRAQAAERARVRDANGGDALVIPHHPAVRRKNTPSTRTKPPTPAPKPRTGKTTPTTPLPPIDRVGLAELTTWAPFQAVHARADAERQNYLHLGRRDWVTLDGQTYGELNPRVAFALPANNLVARTRYARTMGEHLERLAQTLPSGTPVFFVTLINREHTVPRRSGARFDPRRVVGWTHAELQGFNYVGMVEAAYFSNLKTLGGPNRRYLSWHTHMLLWGPTEAELAERIEGINRRFITGVPGRTAAHYRRLELEEVFGQGLYMTKGQINEYRAWPKRIEVANPDTGEVLKLPTRNYTVKKRPLRPGDAIHLCRAFAGRTINDLAFAARDGRAVLDEINREALAEFHRWEARQPYKLAEERRSAARKSTRAGKRPK